MAYYELISLLPGTLSDGDTQTAVDTLQKHLERFGAHILKHGVWERRKLAYPINRVRQGIYLVSEFDLEPAQTHALERALRLEKHILRHQLIKAHKKTAREIEQEARRKAEEREPRFAEARKVVAPAAPAITGQELEEKLEELLTDDMTK